MRYLYWPLVLIIALGATAAPAQVPNKVITTAPQPALNRNNAGVVGSPNIQIAGSALQSDYCSGIDSAGYGSPMLGVNFNVQRTDTNCKRIRVSKLLQAQADQIYNLGDEATAMALVYGSVQVMCADPAYRLALREAGRPCETFREH